MLTIRFSLTDEEAERLWLVVDGVLDAGACEDGLSEVEREACYKLCDTIIAARARKKAKAK